MKLTEAEEKEKKASDALRRDLGLPPVATTTTTTPNATTHAQHHRSDHHHDEGLSPLDAAPSLQREAAPDDRPVVLTLCTGNAARSVMAGVMLEAAGAPVRVITAGTHVVENQPTSRRTRDALARLGLDASAHRSRQLADADLDAADLVIAMAAEHVRYVRRRHPGRRRPHRHPALAGLAPAPRPRPLATRVAALAPGRPSIPTTRVTSTTRPAARRTAYTACAAPSLGSGGRARPPPGLIGPRPAQPVSRRPAADAVRDAAG